MRLGHLYVQGIVLARHNQPGLLLHHVVPIILKLTSWLTTILACDAHNIRQQAMQSCRPLAKYYRGDEIMNHITLGSKPMYAGLLSTWQSAIAGVYIVHLQCQILLATVPLM